jgi:hypothetical protein
VANPVSKSTPRRNRTIVMPFDQDRYPKLVESPEQFRAAVDHFSKLHPELFPPEISSGYTMKEICRPKKLQIPIRRITVGGAHFTVRPAFVLPYQVGVVGEIESALFLRKFDVPFWALARVFGRNAMYWYRIEQSLGRNSVVGTTVNHAESLPEHLAADEKHTRIQGKKTYVATTVGNQCILGVSLAQDASEKALTKAYGAFKDEAQCLDPEYSPKSVNTDGWKATKGAWKRLFPSIVLISCFLHVFIKIRDRCSKKYRELYLQVSEKLWNCYKAKNKASFSQQVRRLYEWVLSKPLPDVIVCPIEKLRDNLCEFTASYDCSGAHRTSNMVDRLMQWMDRHLFTIRYFHGTLSSAELNIRGWALIRNFAPCNPSAVKKHHGSKSPAERLNQSRYHSSWLQNLLISASLGGYRSPPLNPL